MPARKILYIVNHIDWFWSHRLPLATGAKNHGFEVLVAVAGAQDDPRMKTEGFTGIDLPANPAILIRRTHHLIKTHQPDILHVITLKYVFLAGIAARACPHLRVVYTIAGLGYLFSGEGIKPKILRLLAGPLLKFALNHPNAQIILQNRDDLDLMVQQNFLKKERAHLIPGSGVDTEKFTPQSEADQNPPVILMPTRLVRDKGIHIFAHAAEILKQRGVNAKFQIAGGLTHHNPNAMTGEDMKTLTRKGAVEWLGKVDDMPALLVKSTIIAYPSWYGEGVPKVLLEAAACGKPIITTDHPGCREAVKHGENGLLVPVKNAPALADAIETLLQDSGKRNKMGATGRKMALEKFDVRHIVAQTLKLYAN